MSRRSWSWSCVCQLSPTAPSMCPASYALVSTSTSTRRTPFVLRFCFTQSVVTSTSGCLYPLMFCSLRLGSCGRAFGQIGNVSHHVRHVLEDVVGEEHHAESVAVAFGNAA